MKKKENERKKTFKLANQSPPPRTARPISSLCFSVRTRCNQMFAAASVLIAPFLESWVRTRTRTSGVQKETLD